MQVRKTGNLNHRKQSLKRHRAENKLKTLKKRQLDPTIWLIERRSCGLLKQAGHKVASLRQNAKSLQINICHSAKLKPKMTTHVQNAKAQLSYIEEDQINSCNVVNTAARAESWRSLCVMQLQNCLQCPFLPSSPPSLRSADQKNMGQKASLAQEADEAVEVFSTIS
ncbi:hypothetical protein ILYODFUR_015682, partial [Ilyodon furcidens]